MIVNSLTKRRCGRAAGLILTVCAIIFPTNTYSKQPSAQPNANAGILTCIVSPGSKEPFGVERELSCNYKPITGVNVGFVGVVKRLGANVPSDNKIVLAWSVLAPTSVVSPSLLVGDYVGALSSNVRGDEKRRAAIGLIGGQDQSIALQPLNSTNARGSKTTISVLELKLSKIKA